MPKRKIAKAKVIPQLHQFAPRLLGPKRCIVSRDSQCLTPATPARMYQLYREQRWAPEVYDWAFNASYGKYDKKTNSWKPTPLSMKYATEFDNATKTKKASAVYPSFYNRLKLKIPYRELEKLY